jgi:hypothetical protein
VLVKLEQPILALFSIFQYVKHVSKLQKLTKIRLGILSTIDAAFQGLQSHVSISDRACPAKAGQIGAH